MGTKWTAAEDKRLEEMIKAGMIARDIAKELGRTISAVYVRSRNLRLTRYENEVTRNNSRDFGGDGESVAVGGSED
jgi:IS30 family transposase